MSTAEAELPLKILIHEAQAKLQSLGEDYDRLSGEINNTFTQSHFSDEFRTLVEKREDIKKAVSIWLERSRLERAAIGRLSSSKLEPIHAFDP
jgi:hypothetical protein